MNIKNERGSLTLFVAISMLFFMTFLLTLYISTTNQQKTQLEVTARIKETYEQDLNNIEDVYNSFVGTADIIPIYNKEQLQKVGSGENVYISQLGKYYKFNLDSNYILKNNIELNNYTIDADGNEVFADNAEQWTPIGTEATPFKGNFDGNGYKIDGLYINSKSNHLGLFGVMESGTIENLTVAGSVTGKEGTQNTAGIVGSISGTGNVTINNCINSCKVYGEYQIGGIVGYNTNANTILNNCFNKGNIEGKRTIKSSDNQYHLQLGGICGLSNGNINITLCCNEGTIKSIQRKSSCRNYGSM